MPILKTLLEKWGLSSLKINVGILEAEFNPNDRDRSAAWELYVELLTRVTTQALPADQGDEDTALDSVHSLFPTTREILRRNTSECIGFAKIAIVVLNQVVRPFTARWHKRKLQGAFKKKPECKQFRRELSALQDSLKNYTRLLADLAQVEDLTTLEDSNS